MRIETLLRQMERDRIPGHFIPIGLLLYQSIKSNPDNRQAAAARYLAEEYGFTEIRVRNAIKCYVSKGYFLASIKARRYTMLRLGPALTQRAENRAENRAQVLPKIRPELIDLRAENRAEKRATGVLWGYGVPPAVDTAVSPLGLKAVLQQGAAKIAAPVVSSLEARKQADYGRLCRHISDTWKAKKKRADISPQWSEESWINLARQIRPGRFTCQEIAALWDDYLQLTDPFVSDHGYPLLLFCTRRLDGLADSPSYKRRAQDYAADWAGRPRPEPEKPPQIWQDPARPKLTAAQVHADALDRHRITTSAPGLHCRISMCELCSELRAAATDQTRARANAPNAAARETALETHAEPEPVGAYAGNGGESFY